jgi:cell volume regulation protein A
MLLARPIAEFICLAPFQFESKEKLFIAWVGLRGAVGIFLASIPLLVGLPSAYLYFDVAFMVVLISLLVQGWTLSAAARRLGVALRRGDTAPQRVELDLPGSLEQELVGYSVATNSPYLRRGLIPSWAKPTLFIRDERIMTPEEASEVRAGDYVYLLAPPEKAQALDRFFVDLPPPRAPDPRLLGDFFVPGTATLGALADIYGLQIAADHMDITLADQFTEELKRPAKQGDIIHIGLIALLAHKVSKGVVTTVGLQLAEVDGDDALQHGLKAALAKLRKWLRLDRAA